MRLTILPYQIYLAKMACQLISLERIIGISTQIQNQIIKGQKSLTIKPGASIEGKRIKTFIWVPTTKTFNFLLAITDGMLGNWRRKLKMEIGCWANSPK